VELRREDTHVEHFREIARAATVAYNEKSWSKVQSLLSPECVYDEKATHRRIQGIGKDYRGVAGLGNGNT